MTDLDGVRPAPAPTDATTDAAPAGPGGNGTGLLDHFTATARRSETFCGDGSVVWHDWGAGDPVVLLHGGSGSWRHWVRNIPALARKHHVLAPDIPGLGESAMPPGHEPAAVAAILAEGLDALLGPGARYHLAGFSFGALVSGHLAALRDADLRSLTLVGAGGLGVARVRAPLNVVYGERDAIAWPMVQARVDTLREVRPDAEAAIIPGAGHWVSYEAAERFDAILAGMLGVGRPA